VEPVDEVALRMSPEELRLLLEGLDAYEYWQLGDVLPRNNGLVFLPDDEGAERYWSDEITDAQTQAIDAVRACRALAERLRSQVSLTD
jgi:hypothetical protein